MPRPPPPAAALTSAGIGIPSGICIDPSSPAVISNSGAVGTPDSIASFFAATLSPSVRICSAVGPTQINPAAATLLRDVGVLGEEAVARVDRLAPVVERDLDDRIGAQVRLGRGRSAERHGDVDGVDVHRVGVRLGVDADRRDARAGAPSVRSARRSRPDSQSTTE